MIEENDLKIYGDIFKKSNTICAFCGVKQIAISVGIELSFGNFSVIRSSYAFISNREYTIGKKIGTLKWAKRIYGKLFDERSRCQNKVITGKRRKFPFLFGSDEIQLTSVTLCKSNR